MSHPLDGCWAKLGRAKEHLDTLKREIAEYAYDMKVEAKIDCERGQFLYVVVDSPVFPIRWGTVVGDALHNFRSALDYLAFEAVRLCSGQYWMNTQFPIVDWPGGYAKFFRNQGTMERLSPELRAVVERAQGYSRGYGIFAHPHSWTLGQLRDFANLDKHKLILAIGMTPDAMGRARVISSQDVDIGKFFHYWSGLALAKGTELLKLDITCTGPNPNVQVEYDFVPVITFAGPAVTGGDIPRFLDDVGAVVTEIVSECEPFFE